MSDIYASINDHYGTVATVYVSRDALPHQGEYIEVDGKGVFKILKVVHRVPNPSKGSSAKISGLTLWVEMEGPEPSPKAKVYHE